MAVYRSSSCRSLGLGVNQFGPSHADVKPHMIVQFLSSPRCNPSIRDHIIFRGRCYASSKLLVHIHREEAVSVNMLHHISVNMECHK